MLRTERVPQAFSLAVLLSLLIFSPAVFAATPLDWNTTQVSQGDDQARRLMKEAEQAAGQGNLQEALNLLEEAKKHVRSSKRFLKVNELSAKYEARLKGKELREKELEHEAEKARKLMEVDAYWFPPEPYPKEAIEAEKPVELKPIEERTQKRIALIDFKDATLKEVLEFLAQATDVNIVIDEKSVPVNDLVTLRLKNIPMIQALDYILKSKGLGTRVEENFILVTDPSNLGQDLEVRVYDVQDLVGKLHDFPAKPFDFENLTKQSGGGQGGSPGEGGQGGGESL